MQKHSTNKHVCVHQKEKLVSFDTSFFVIFFQFLNKIYRKIEIRSKVMENIGTIAIYGLLFGMLRYDVGGRYWCVFESEFE